MLDPSIRIIITKQSIETHMDFKMPKLIHEGERNLELGFRRERERELIEPDRPLWSCQSRSLCLATNLIEEIMNNSLFREIIVLFDLVLHMSQLDLIVCIIQFILYYFIFLSLFLSFIFPFYFYSK